MIRVSVIVPLYKSAQFLPTLFGNLQQQSIASDIECIFIDDHGGDDSTAVARSLAADAPFKCLFGATAANGGPGAARNAGLSLATGEYIAFLDSDDALNATFCERLYDAAFTANADLAYGHILEVNGSRSRVRRNPVVGNGDFNQGKREYFLTHYKSFFTSFIYRRSFLLENGIDFPATRSGEDSCFLAKALLLARRIACVNEALYHYVRREGSITKESNPFRYEERLKSFDALLDFAREKGIYGPDSDKDLLDYIYIKKAMITGVLDCRSARSEIVNHCTNRVPDMRGNRYLRRDPAARLAVFALQA